MTEEKREVTVADVKESARVLLRMLALEEDERGSWAELAGAMLISELWESGIVSFPFPVRGCTEDEYHYTEHDWERPWGSANGYRCKHCGEVVPLEACQGTEGVNLEEYGGCETPREWAWNSDGRMYANGVWWKRVEK